MLVEIFIYLPFWLRQLSYSDNKINILMCIFFWVTILEKQRIPRKERKKKIKIPKSSESKEKSPIRRTQKNPPIWENLNSFAFDYPSSFRDLLTCLILISNLAFGLSSHVPHRLFTDFVSIVQNPIIVKSLATGWSP